MEMSEPLTTIAAASFALLALAIATFALLKGWQGWLEIKRFELTAGRQTGSARAFDRIEIADLKERVRKLESIAACVDL